MKQKLVAPFGAAQLKGQLILKCSKAKTITREKSKERRHIKRVANEDDILTFSQSN